MASVLTWMPDDRDAEDHSLPPSEPEAIDRLAEEVRRLALAVELLTRRIEQMESYTGLAAVDVEIDPFSPMKES